MDDSTPNNWGRWGADDELGSLNLLTPETVLKAVRYVRTGRVYSLGLVIERYAPMLGNRLPMAHFMAEDGGDFAVGVTREMGVGAASDYFMMSTHGSSHIDAFCHAWVDGLMYNGHASSEVVSAGARRNSIDKVRSVVGRGVFLNVAALHGPQGLRPGHAVTPDDLEQCEKAASVRVGAGDIVLLRLGWVNAEFNDRARYAEARPGLHADLARWFADRDVAAVGTDAGSEPRPGPQDDPYAIHIRVLRNLGTPLIEMLNLEELARDGVTDFMFVACPLLIKGGTGSPLNPLAIT